MDHPPTSPPSPESWHHHGANAGGIRRPSSTEEKHNASLLLGLASGGGGSGYTVDGSGGDTNDAVPLSYRGNEGGVDTATAMSSSSPCPSVAQKIERATTSTTTTTTTTTSDDDAGLVVVSQESGGGDIATKTMTVTSAAEVDLGDYECSTETASREFVLPSTSNLPMPCIPPFEDIWKEKEDETLQTVRRSSSSSITTKGHINNVNDVELLQDQRRTRSSSRNSNNNNNKRPRLKGMLSVVVDQELQLKENSSSSSNDDPIPKLSLSMPVPLLPHQLPQLSPTTTTIYEEESSWRYYNPTFPPSDEPNGERLTQCREGEFVSNINLPTSADELRPLPPPVSLTMASLPNTGYCNWSYDDETRVLLADFRNAPQQQRQSMAGRQQQGGKRMKRNEVHIESEDEIFLLHMMEKDDITVLSEGLADTINPSFWKSDYIEGCIGSEYHHKFRSFIEGREKDGWYSMKFSDYLRYLERRECVKNNRKNVDGSSGGGESNGSMTVVNDELPNNTEFTFTDSYGEVHSVNVDTEAIYMLDVDATKLLPRAWEDLQRNFKLPGILPGGAHCMMNAVNANGRPFMGPNLYVTPPTSFTAFHQDGHGTVDSGHWCMAGYNEVVMLRRLTERHKCHAVKLLTGTTDSYATLYGLPHRDGNMAGQPDWPSINAINQCKEMGYCPSVFILKPGQVVHINKGRLHAFRKLAPKVLHETDCHFELRTAILRAKEEESLTIEEDICKSIAWDWMFKGVTSEGINREVSSILECSRLNRQHGLQSLAIPETALLFLAKENIAKHEVESRTNIGDSSLFAIDDKFVPDSTTVIRGILPSLEYVVTRHRSAVEFSEYWEKETKNVKDSWCVLIDTKPNTWQDPTKFPLDP